MPTPVQGQKVGAKRIKTGVVSPAEKMIDMNQLKLTTSLTKFPNLAEISSTSGEFLTGNETLY